jgi:small conductance mechanosensitive channel
LPNIKSFLLLCLLLSVGSFNVLAADAPAAPSAPPAAAGDPAPEEPAKAEILVKGGLLGAISTSIDSVQDKLDVDGHLLDAWRLRADRAADEIDALVNKPQSRSAWRIAGDFVTLSLVWAGAFLLLNRIGAFVVARLSKRRILAHRDRAIGVIGYVFPYMLPALVCLPLTLYVSHFMPTSVGRALALCLAYSTSSGIFSTSVLLSLIVLFNSGHKRPGVRIIRHYAPHPLFIIGFLAALSDALTSPQISRLLGGNVTTSIAAFSGLMASIMFAIVVIRMRRPIAHLIRNRPLGARLARPAVQQTLKIFSSLWHLPILLMILVSAVNLIGAGEGSQEALRCALLTTVLLIATVFLSTLFQHMFKPTEARTGRVYKERLLSLLHAVMRIALAIGFIELLGRIWGVSLFEFAQRNALGKAISDSLSSIGLILLVTWLLWVVMDTAIQEALKPPTNGRSSHQPSTRVKTILPLLRNAMKIILVVICTITTMANLGINVAPLLAGAGVVGLAIGFGSQQLVQDVITGLFIIIEDTISIGDWVVLDSGHAGTVESLTIRTLRLRDGKGFVHSVPFGQIKAVTNQSRQFAYAFFSFQFTYDTDVDAATSLIREAGQSISDDLLLSGKLQGPLEVFGLDRMDMNGIVITAQFRTSSGGQYAVSRAFNDRLKRLVDKSPDVRFAQTYPQLVMSPHNRQASESEESGGEQQPLPGKTSVVNKDGSESPA